MGKVGKAQFCKFKHTSTGIHKTKGRGWARVGSQTSARMGSIGRNKGGGQSSKHERLNFASSSTCTLKLAKLRARTGSILPI